MSTTVTGYTPRCTNVHYDPEWWFAEQRTPEHEQMRTKAIHICRGCPLQTACYTFASRVRAEHGIWGGVWFGRHKKTRED